MLPRLLLTALVLGLLAACGGTPPETSEETPIEIPEDPTETPAEADVIISLNSIGSSAWFVEAVTGSETVAATGAENPNAPWTLAVGTRYRVENEAGSSAHPFELLGSSMAMALLSQEQDDQEGSLEENAAINYVEDSDGVTFTMTQELADLVESYFCFYHPNMISSVTVE